MATRASRSFSWEETFQSWGKPPGTTEQEKCDNAVRAVRKAIDASTALAGRTITVSPQGSYHNRTNVRTDSDVDVRVVCHDSIFFDLPEGRTPTDFGITTPAKYSFSQFKNDVEDALVSYFGRNFVTRGNKAFDIHENSYRVDADVVPCFGYHRYQENGLRPVGTAFLASGTTRIINWPDQNYENGVAKNDATNRRFKAVVRILKRLRNVMDENNIGAAKPTPSFLIECLVWNVPNVGFGHEIYAADVRWVLAHLFNNTRNKEDCAEWGEINELKYLLRGGQPWTLAQAHAFISAAWDYLGFE
jgi:hypothetical protein